MTRVLASVTCEDEARVALETGADIIDLKNPAQGALGALPLGVIERVVRLVDGRVPVSATVGDLPMQPALLCDSVAATAATGVDIVKIGLFGQQHLAECISALRGHAARHRLVAVLFADQGPDFSLLPVLAQHGFCGAMLDTATKLGGGLRHWLDDERLAEFVSLCRIEGLWAGLAGSLRPEDVPPLLPLGADYLGFRGALCQENRREAKLEQGRTAALVKAVAQMQQVDLVNG
jgi:(5-formylfuran-3-yl)methyl phosphate synthase